MSDEEIAENYKHFEEIIYDNLQRILETRPKNPVSKFARMILDEAGLDKNGDPLPDREQPPKRKERGGSDKDSSEGEEISPKTKKDKKKALAEKESDDEEKKPKESKKKREEEQQEEQEFSGAKLDENEEG